MLYLWSDAAGGIMKIQIIFACMDISIKWLRLWPKGLAKWKGLK
jgi:hypothetical protein